MNRSMLARLYDIDENIALVRDLARHRTLDHLRNDAALRYAILHALMIIAEAVRHVPDDVKIIELEVPWNEIVALGDMIKREHHCIDAVILWETVQIHLPALHPVITRLMSGV